MNQRVLQRCIGMLSCIMEVMETQIESSYPHTARYGLDYVRKLQSRIDISKKKHI